MMEHLHKGGGELCSHLSVSSLVLTDRGYLYMEPMPSNSRVVQLTY